jgi:predicted Rossmann-fold nucleotide-binding protein
MKAIVAGGRDFKPTHEHYEWLYRLCVQLNVNEIISGGCAGADTFGAHFAADNDIEVKVFKADWKKYGKAAGPIRNLAMAKYADICILFFGGSGTINMLKCARQFGLHVEQWDG